MGSLRKMGLGFLGRRLMPRTAFEVDLSRPPEAAEIKTHNRWHPDIPMVEMFKPGVEFRVECFDWTRGQIENNDSANDVRNVDLMLTRFRGHPTICVRGAHHVEIGTTLPT
jgi:hypothetical protein